jgi:hypothetical protein
LMRVPGLVAKLAVPTAVNAKIQIFNVKSCWAGGTAYILLFSLIIWMFTCLSRTTWGLFVCRAVDRWPPARRTAPTHRRDPMSAESALPTHACIIWYRKHSTP